MSDPVVIVSAARTPMGSFQGDFSALSAHDLGGTAIAAAVQRAGISPDAVTEVLLGNCLMAGQGQAPARQAVFKGGLPKSAGAVTLSKMCGSGMRAAMFAHDILSVGSQEVIIAGLEDAYEAGRSMGTFGEDCAAKYNFSRDAQDHFAMTSVERAKAATESGAFAVEITPVTVKDRAGERVISIDEGPGKVKLDKVKTLKPAFKKDGTITAASSSSINDGAAALVMMRESTAKKLGCTPLARIVSHATFAQAPEWFTTAPVGATQQALARAGWKVSDVDLWEVNEAFAVVPMALMHELKVPHEIVNINGGACALGHPIGASGARIIVTLLHALKAKGLKKGLATLCIGGGEGTAMALEMI